MRKKVFWGTFTILSLVATVVLPLIWGIVATLPLLVGSWWFAYRSELFDD